MYRFVLFLVLVFPTCSLAETISGPLVQTKSGAIRGHYLTSYKGNKYESYQGIPYALPPTSERRFESPVPVEPWTNELQATQLKDQCLQDFPPSWNQPVTGSEDCLHLSVYVPQKKKTNESLPVIFYIYGGAFRREGIIDGQEQYIIDYDVIFASANYRTGSLGFLSTEDHVVPGNMALKDQSTALRWVYDNIEHFGGDPKRITLMGGSSGATCVHFHYLSPWSRGLFHAGISMSGTAFASSAVAARSREKAIALGRQVNCTDTDIGEMIKCMKDVPAVVLVEAQNKLEEWKDLLSVFGPAVEKSSTDPFIDDYPKQIVQQGRAYDVPWITGIVSEEGLGLTAGYYTHSDTLKSLDENWDTSAPSILDYVYFIPLEQQVSVARKSRNHYLGNKTMNRENLHNLTMLIGDRLFAVGAINAAKAQATANKSPIFFHYYKYRATDSFSNFLSNSTEDFGVCHADDTLLVIGNKFMIPTKSATDMAMQKRLIKIWTSVAYNAVPKVDVGWQKVASNTTTKLDYVVIAGPNDLRADYNDNLAENQFWNSVGFDEN